MNITGYVLNERGQKEPFHFRVEQPAANAAGHWATIHCSHLTGGSLCRVLGESDEERCALACSLLCQILKDRLLYDEAGFPVTPPCAQDFVPDWPTSEEVERLVEETEDFGRRR